MRLTRESSRFSSRWETGEGWWCPVGIYTKTIFSKDKVKYRTDRHLTTRVKLLVSIRLTTPSIALRTNGIPFPGGSSGPPGLHGCPSGSMPSTQVGGGTSIALRTNGIPFPGGSSGPPGLQGCPSGSIPSTQVGGGTSTTRSFRFSRASTTVASREFSSTTSC